MACVITWDLDLDETTIPAFHGRPRVGDEVVLAATGETGVVTATFYRNGDGGTTVAFSDRKSWVVFSALVVTSRSVS
jgi:hypothetical protein